MYYSAFKLQCFTYFAGSAQLNIHTSVTPSSVDERSNVTFTCNFTETIYLGTVHWTLVDSSNNFLKNVYFHNTSYIEKGYSTYNSAMVQTYTSYETLTLMGIMPSDMGRYNCKVTNNDTKSGNHTTDLIVNCKFLH